MNEKVTWPTDSGYFLIERYGTTIENGFGILLNEEGNEEFKKKEETKIQDLKSHF